MQVIISAIWYRRSGRMVPSFHVVGLFIAVMWHRTQYRSLTFWLISVCSGTIGATILHKSIFTPFIILYGANINF
mgnify:CR=1 FL=1